MSAKQKSYAALTREVERQRAQIEELKSQVSRQFHVDRDRMLDVIDLRIRSEQAVRILTGVDE